jgi:predicted kinase
VKVGDFSLINQLFAGLLSKHVTASYLRIDTIEQSLKEIYGLDVYSEGYQLAYRLVSDSLAQGLSVVADSCNSVQESRDEWELTAINSMAQYINIEICCSDETEHRARIENRKSVVKRLILPTWEDVKAREFHTWGKDVISIDTAGQSPEQSMKQLFVKLGV